MSASEPAGRTDYLRLVLFLCCGFGIALQFGRVPASLAAIRGELDLTLTATGWIVSTISVIAALGGLLAGMLAARFGAVNWVASGLVLCILGCGLGWLAPDVPGLISGRVVEGAGFIMAATGLPPLIVRAAGPARASVALALWGIYLPVGMALMLAVAPLVIAQAGWRGALVANMIVLAALLTAFVIAAHRYRAPGAQRSAPLPLAAGLAFLKADPDAFRLAGIFLLYAAQFLAVMSFLPLTFRAAGAAGTDLIGHATALIVLLNGVGNLLGARGLAHGIAPQRLLCLGLVMMGVMGAAALTDALPWTVRLMAAGLMSFCSGLVPATLLGGVAHLAIPPAARAAAVGLLLQGAGIGQLVGPPMFAAVASHHGWTAAAGLALGLSGLALALALSRRDPARSPG